VGETEVNLAFVHASKKSLLLICTKLLYKLYSCMYSEMALVAQEVFPVPAMDLNLATDGRT